MKTATLDECRIKLYSLIYYNKNIRPSSYAKYYAAF